MIWTKMPLFEPDFRSIGFKQRLTDIYARIHINKSKISFFFF